MVIVRPWALRQTLRVLALAVVLAAATRGHGVLANPQGGTVAAGDAEIVTTSASRIDINQHSDRAIINWESFDIGAGEHTHFEQPSATAFALNRVAGSNITEIFGALTATGRIAIVNPHGIHFGPTSQVDVAGLVATTTDIRDSPFMAGSLFFDLPSPHNGRIVNEGRITLADAGLLAFVAPGVENTGTITARLGRVSLASGNAFTLDLFGDNLVNLAVGDAVAGNIAGVDQIGTIVADGGLVQISAEVAEGVVDRVINMSGIVEARSIGSTGGRIVLDGGNSGDVEVSGVLTASGTEAGEMSGTVTVTGASVTLASTARIAATGDTGGGTVFIGGEFGGSGETRTADTTTVQSGALIDASALTSGDGGQVAIWADESTRFDGFILAKGGSDSGNGGYVETSGASIAFAGTVDTSAPNGSGGTWLIDPDTLNIGATEAATIVTALGNGTSVNAEATTTTNLNSAIDSSAQVTTATLTFGDEGAPTGLTINLNAAITLGSNQTLTGQGTTVNVASTGLIQNGIDVALAGTSTRVNVAAGTFSEDVNFNKQLILSFDSNTGVTINSLSAPDSSTLRAMLGILTATNGFAIQSPMVLGTSQLATSSANVRFTKAVDGTSSDQTLSINAGTGQVRFDSTIGSTTFPPNRRHYWRHHHHQRCNHFRRAAIHRCCPAQRRLQRWRFERYYFSRYRGGNAFRRNGNHRYDRRRHYQLPINSRWFQQSHHQRQFQYHHFFRRDRQNDRPYIHQHHRECGLGTRYYDEWRTEFWRSRSAERGIFRGCHKRTYVSCHRCRHTRRRRHNHGDHGRRHHQICLYRQRQQQPHNRRVLKHDRIPRDGRRNYCAYVSKHYRKLDNVDRCNHLGRPTLLGTHTNPGDFQCWRIQRYRVPDYGRCNPRRHDVDCGNQRQRQRRLSIDARRRSSTQHSRSF